MAERLATQAGADSLSVDDAKSVSVSNSCEKKSGVQDKLTVHSIKKSTQEPKLDKNQQQIFTRIGLSAFSQPLQSSLSETEGVYLEKTSDVAAHKQLQLQKLVDEILHIFSFSAHNIDVRVDNKAENMLNKISAHGVMTNENIHSGVIYLHPRYFDPDTHRGRYLLGHEMAHLAQWNNRLRGKNANSREALEKEAHQAGQLIAEKRLPLPPRLVAQANIRLADTGASPAARQQQEETQQQSESSDLSQLVGSRYHREIARIEELLRGVWGFLWVTDGMVEEIMVLLQATQSFAVQRNIVSEYLSDDQKNTLMGNISSGHRQRFRKEVLAVYSAMPASILREQNHSIFDGMDLARLSREELFSISHVKAHMPTHEWIRLRENGNEALRHHITEIDRLNGAGDLTEEELEASEAQAAENLQEQANAELAANAAVIGDAQLAAWVETVKAQLREGASDSEKIAILDCLLPYMGQPEKIRGVAQILQAPEEDLLTPLLEEFPARALYQGSETEDTHSDTRLAVFLRLASYRPVHANVLLIQELLSINHVANFFLSFLLFVPLTRVTEDEAFIAYQLLKILPEDIRENLLATQVDEETYGTRVVNAMSQEMREAESLNFFGNSAEGRQDLASIQSQLMDDEVWEAVSPGRLIGLIRMAIAAGHHRWVFSQSRLRYQNNRSIYMEDEFRENVVDRFRLYNPEAEPEPRTEYRPEYLRAIDTPFIDWPNMPAISWLESLINLGILLSNSGDGAQLAGSTIFGNSITGEHVNIIALQEYLGGNFMGIRFTQHEQLDNGEEAVREGRGVNFIDSLRWDTRRGVMDVHAANLDIAQVRYRTGSILVQAGHGELVGLNLHLAYPVEGGNERNAPAMDLSISSLQLNDFLVALSGSLIAINSIRTGSLRVQIGEDTMRGLRDEARTGFDFTSLSIITPLLRMISLGMGELTDRTTQLTEGLTAAPNPVPISVNLRELVLEGITLSGGQYIERLELNNIHLGIGGTREHYKRVLFESYRDLIHRVAELDTHIQRQQPQGEELNRLTRQRERLVHQRDTTIQLRRQISAAERRVPELRQMRNDDPDSFSATQARELHNLVQFLQRFDRGGITINAGRVRITGVAGAGGSFNMPGTLELNSLHGHGTTAEGLAGLIPGTDTLLRMVRGESFHPPTRAGQPPREDSNFELDIGDINLEEGFTVGASIPTVESARDNLAEAEKQLARRPWDPRLVEAHEKARARLTHTQTYHRMVEIGVTYLTPRQLEAFNEARRYLTRDVSLSVGSFHAAGANLTFGHRGQQIGIHAQTLDIGDIRIGESMTPVGTGEIRIAAVHGRDVNLGGGFLGGVFGAGDSRALISRLADVGVSGEHLRITGIEQFLPGVSDGVPVTSVGAVRLDNFALHLNAQDGVVDARSGEINVDNLRIQVTADSLRAEIEQLEAKPVAQRSTREIARLEQLHTMLETLEGFETALHQISEEIESESDDEALTELRQQQAFLISAYDQWQVQLGARSIRVAGLDARISGFGNITDENFSFERVLAGERGITIEGQGTSTTQRDSNGNFRNDRIFGELQVTDGRFSGGEVSEINVGETHGSASYSRSNIRLNNIAIENFSVNQFFMMAGGHQIWSDGLTQVNGISVTAHLRFEANPEHPEEYLLREINVDNFRVNELIADHVGYWNPDMNAQIDIQSGTIGGLHAENLQINIPDNDQEQLTIRGSAGIDTVTETRFTAYIQDRVQFAHGTLNGSNLTVDFLQSGDRRFRIGDLSLTDGYVRTDAGFIRVTARNLSGDIVQTDEGYNFENIELPLLRLNRFSWRAGAREFRGDLPTTIRGIRLNGSVNTQEENNTRVSITHLHFDSLVSQHFRYHEGDLTVEIRQPTEAEGASSATDAAAEGGAPRARAPLEVINVDIRNLDWSARTGVRPSEGHRAATVDVGRRTGSAEDGREPIHAALNVLSGDLDLDVTVDASGLSLEFLRDGTQVINARDIDGTVRGTAMDGLDVDVSFTGANTGDISVNGREVDVPDLHIPTIEVNSLHYNSDDYEIKIPDGESGGATLLNTRANLHLTRAEEDSDLPFEKLVIRSLHIPTVRTIGAKIVIKNAVSIGGSRRDIIFLTSETETTHITDLRLMPLEEGGDAFSVTMHRDASTGELAPEISGRLTLADAVSRAANMQIPGILNAHANVRLDSINIGLLGSAGRSVNIGQIDLEELFANYDGNQVNVGTYTGHTELPDRDQQALPHTNPHHGPRMVISGFEMEQDGSINVDSISAHGLVYENPELGIRVQIRDAIIPRDGEEPGLRYDASTRMIDINQATITEATFRIDDLGNLINSDESESDTDTESSMPEIDFWQVPDALNGVIRFSLSGQRWFVPDAVRTLHVEDGSLSLDELEGYYSVLVDFEMDGNNLQLVVDRALVDAIATNPNDPDPHMHERPPIPLQIWENLDASERAVVRGGRVLISTLIRRRQESSGPPTDVGSYVNVENLEADLWLRGAPIVSIGETGQLQIQGRNDPNHLDIHAEGSVPGQLNLTLANLTASIVEGHPLSFGNVLLNRGSLELEQLRDVELDITDFNAAGLGELTGTITRATANDLQVQLPPSESSDGD